MNIKILFIIIPGLIFGMNQETSKEIINILVSTWKKRPELEKDSTQAIVQIINNKAYKWINRAEISNQHIKK